MEHLAKMRTRFRLGQVVTYKSKHGIHKGEVVGLHDDFVRVKDITIKQDHFFVYRVAFEDIIG